MVPWTHTSHHQCTACRQCSLNKNNILAVCECKHLMSLISESRIGSYRCSSAKYWPISHLSVCLCIREHIEDLNGFFSDKKPSTKFSWPFQSTSGQSQVMTAHELHLSNVSSVVVYIEVCTTCTKYNLCTIHVQYSPVLYAVSCTYDNRWSPVSEM